MCYSLKHLAVFIFVSVVTCQPGEMPVGDLAADPDGSSNRYTYEQLHAMAMNQEDVLSEWSPIQMINGNSFTFGNYALLVLNRPIEILQNTMVSIWNKAALRITVDGGTKYWYQFKGSFDSDASLVKIDPDIVCGDFDSITTDVLQKVRNVSGIQVVETPDFNKTDFVKALEQVANHKDNIELDSIVVVAEYSGRPDKLLSVLDTLHKADRILGSRIVIFVVTKESLSWILRPGYHNIHVPMRVWGSNCWCGLIPLAGPATVTTSGLKWNLEKQVLRFGDMISSSNTYGDVSYQREGVSVKTDEKIVWAMGTCSDNMGEEIIPLENY